MAIIEPNLTLFNLSFRSSPTIDPTEACPKQIPKPRGGWVVDGGLNSDAFHVDIMNDDRPIDPGMIPKYHHLKSCRG